METVEPGTLLRLAHAVNGGESNNELCEALSRLGFGPKGAEVPCANAGWETVDSFLSQAMRAEDFYMLSVDRVPALSIIVDCIVPYVATEAGFATFYANIGHEGDASGYTHQGAHETIAAALSRREYDENIAVALRATLASVNGRRVLRGYCCDNPQVPHTCPEMRECFMMTVARSGGWTANTVLGWLIEAGCATFKSKPDPGPAEE